MALLHHFSLHNVGVLHLAIKQLFLCGTLWLLPQPNVFNKASRFPATNNACIMFYVTSFYKIWGVHIPCDLFKIIKIPNNQKIRVSS